MRRDSRLSLLEIQINALGGSFSKCRRYTLRRSQEYSSRQNIIQSENKFVGCIPEKFTKFDTASFNAIQNRLSAFQHPHTDTL